MKRFALSILTLLAAASAQAEDAKPAAGPAPAENPGLEGEKVNVDTIKEKYWARGDESELGVVQNRAYSKTRKFEFGLFVGTVTSDPFLTVKSIGGTFGFHFNEYFSAHLLAFKHFVSPSNALLTFESTVGATTNYNPPKSYIGGEAVGSLLYGKLSLLGKSIIYYDFHVLGGLGVTSTETGNAFTPSLGLGQQVYITKQFSVRLDYRAMHYNEDIVERVITPKLGQVVDQRSNWSHSITVGFDFLLEVTKK